MTPTATAPIPTTAPEPTRTEPILVSVDTIPEENTMADLRDAQGNPIVTNETPIRMISDADIQALSTVFATNERVDDVIVSLNETRENLNQASATLNETVTRVGTLEADRDAIVEQQQRFDDNLERMSGALAAATEASIARDNALDQRITQVDQEAQARLTAAQTELTTQITNATTAVNNRVAAVETNIQQQSQLIERVERRNSNLGRNLMVAIGTIVGFAILFGIVGVILMTIDFELLGSTDNWPWVGVVLGLAVGAVVAILLLISATRGNGNTAAAHHA